jgi:flagellar basal body-associated protein FliL
MGNEATQRHASATALWLPIGTVAVVLAVVGGAAITWATDRAELRTTSDLVRKQGDTIDTLKEERAARRVLDEQIKEQLREMRNSIDRIAERVGVKQ